MRLAPSALAGCWGGLLYLGGRRSASGGRVVRRLEGPVLFPDLSQLVEGDQAVIFEVVLDAVDLLDAALDDRVVIRYKRSAEFAFNLNIQPGKQTGFIFFFVILEIVFPFVLLFEA